MLSCGSGRQGSPLPRPSRTSIGTPNPASEETSPPWPRAGSSPRHATSSCSAHPAPGRHILLIGLGTAAAEAGFRVKYTLATKLVNELVEAADEKVLAKTIARYGRVDLLCID